jgi:hypothetical protein
VLPRQTAKTAKEFGIGFDNKGVVSRGLQECEAMSEIADAH